MQNETIGSLVRTAEDEYVDGSTTISKYVEFNQYENINKIEAYLNSKFTSGDVDSLNRPKPFFNIVTAAVNIWYRATDIDRKDIRIKANKSEDFVGAFLATIRLQEWMRRDGFGTFLNDWGRSLARYGSTILKFVEKDGMLHSMVMPWSVMIVDTIDFDNNLKIEKLQLTPAQLRANKSYDQEIVELLLTALESRELLDEQNQDDKDNYIELYEVHGEIAKSYLTGEEKDDDTFVQQMHVITYVKGKEKGEFDDYTLVSGKEKKDPYMITHLIKEDGRTQSIGAVEYLFDAQWMVNHSAKAIKDQLDLASKLIFQTSDGSYVGRNALSSIEQGDILIHTKNEPLTQLANNSHDITSLQNYSQQWQTLAGELTSTPDAIRGNTMPSGTAFRQVAILNQESHSLFELMTENKGLSVEDMMRLHVLPFLKKKFDTTEEISAMLDAHNLTQLDSLYIPNEAIKRFNKTTTEQILNGEQVEPFDKETAEQGIREQLAPFGNQRFFKPSEIDDKTWKEMFKNLEWDVEVEVTGEESNKEAVLTTLSTVLQSIAGNPQLLQDPNARLVFNKILESTNAISPLEIAQTSATPPPPQGDIEEFKGEGAKVGGAEALQNVTQI